ncbi:MAG TPA: tRNA (adenosine(37)-N6)-threonylcarbamoyltransferase complex dimerization subunit type 1 TsaB [Noviherbaspirillum sp.]
MPTILALETSTELASVALLVNQRLLGREAAPVQTHSQTLLPLVQSLLAEAGITLSDCDAIAFGAGPGSFTGVRTACGAVQGLAFGAGLPVVPIVTLEAMAQACHERTGATDVLCVLDARMAEVYWAQYRHGADGWQAVVAPALARPADVVPQGPVRACGNGLAAYADAFAAAAFMAQAEPGIMPHATQVATLAAQRFLRGDIMDAASAQPLYLRNKVALTTAERMAGKAA